MLRGLPEAISLQSPFPFRLCSRVLTPAGCISQAPVSDQLWPVGATNHTIKAGERGRPGIAPLAASSRISISSCVSSQLHLPCLFRPSVLPAFVREPQPLGSGHSTVLRSPVRKDLLPNRRECSHPPASSCQLLQGQPCPRSCSSGSGPSPVPEGGGVIQCSAT